MTRTRQENGAPKDERKRGRHVVPTLFIVLAALTWSTWAEAAPLEVGDILLRDLTFTSSSGELLTRTGPLSADLSLTFGDPEGSHWLEGFAVDRFGRILGYTREDPIRIVAINPASGFAETIASIPGHIVTNLVGLGVSILALADGSVVIAATADQSVTRILRVHPATAVIEVVAEVCPNAGFAFATIAREADGSIVFACRNAVGRVRADSGIVEEIAAFPDIIPVGLVVDPSSGQIVLASLFGGVTSIDPETGLATTLLPGTNDGGPSLVGFALDPLAPGRFVINRNSGDSEIASFDPATGIIEPFTGDVSRGHETLFVVQARCNDGFDNDGDGLIDLADPDCLDPYHNRESSGCGSGFDQALVLFAPLVWVAGRRRVRGGQVERADPC